MQVSWLRRRGGEDVPILLTFGQTVYVSDVRFSIRRSNDDWILDILHAKADDEAIYECQVSTEPPQIHKIFLAVEGKLNEAIWLNSAHKKPLVAQLLTYGNRTSIAVHVTVDIASSENFCASRPEKRWPPRRPGSRRCLKTSRFHL